MATVATQLASLSLNPVQQLRTESFSQRGTSWRVNLIECAKRPQKKATAHHNKTRPKKSNPYDKNRFGSPVYPRLPKPPPIWGYDNGEPLPISEEEEEES